MFPEQANTKQTKQRVEPTSSKATHVECARSSDIANTSIDGKIEYLSMILGTVDRMSSASAILKGFAAAIVTGISAISFTEVNKWVLLLSVLPLLSFGALDVYYLMLERRFRYLFELVRNDIKIVDYSMSVHITRGEGKAARARIVDCVFSPSIALFYLPTIVIAASMVAMKFGGLLDGATCVLQFPL